MMLIQLFIALVIIALIVWAVPQLVSAFNIPQPIANVIHVALVVLVVLWFLSLLLGYGYGGPYFSRPLLR